MDKARNFMSWLLLLPLLLHTSIESYATHAQSADITYNCVGGNVYEITVSFYRDCAGVGAPGSVTVNSSSITCGQNFNTTLNPIPGTGQDVTPICGTMTTECTGGGYPGVQEWQYRGNITLPMACTDWVFSFTLCCRNNAITTIVAPGTENIYVEANLDNLNYPCNSSPQFTNPPIPFMCVGQTFCFNHGASDPDGDSLAYTLVPPATGPITTVTYVPGYSATAPIASSTGVTLDPITGDICMTPTILEVSVMAVLVEEYRAGVLVGSVVRDIQVKTVNCSNNLPTLNGIDNTGQYAATACAGSTLTFDIPSFDPDAGQIITMTWNNGIPGGTFTVDANNPPTATFSWTPTAADISTVPQCFTVTVSDDNCPLNGTQTYAFCVTVQGLDVTLSSTPANCNASNGSATATVVSGTGPYTYSWSAGSTMSFQNGLSPGMYSVTVTDALGCAYTDSVEVFQNGAPGNLTVTGTDISCFGANDGWAEADANGGTPPYAYAWSNGDTTAITSGLAPGWYYVTSTTADGCTKNDSVLISEPPALTLSVSGTDTICPGAPTTLSAFGGGGTGALTYLWNGIPSGDSLTVNPTSDTWYTVTVQDANGCTGPIDSVFILINDINNASLSANEAGAICEGDNATIWATMTGGIGTYTYNWNCGCIGLGPHTVAPTVSTYYTVTATDECANSLSDSVLVLVHPLPDISLPPLNGSDCGEVRLSVTNGSPGPSGTTYYWDMGNGQYSTSDTATTTYYTSGVYTIDVIVTSPYGCVNTGTTTANISILPQAEANFFCDPQVSIFDPTVEFVNTSNNATIFEWDMGDGTLLSTEHVTHTYTATGYYLVTMIANNTYNCPDTITEYVEVQPEFTLYVPNAFTPDGDGVNEIFLAMGEEVQDFEMLIFNRWGELIFTSDHISNGWDGTYHGQPVESEVYVYKLKVKDTLGDWHDLAGHVTLVR